MSDLDNILKEEPENEPEEAVETQEETPEPEPETGTTLAPEGEKEEGETPAPEEIDPLDDIRAELSAIKKQSAAFQAMATDERRKRQSLEAQQELKSEQLDTDFLDEPDKHLDQFERRMTKMMYNERLNMSQAMHAKEEGFEEKIALFEQLAENDTQLANQFAAAPDPFGFALDQASNHRARAEMGDPAAFKSRIVEETTAEVTAKLSALFDKKLQRLTGEGLPRSLEDEPSAGANESDEFTGPPSLDRILAGKS